MGDNGSSYSKIESIWSNAVRLTRSVYPNLQDEIEYIEANLGGGNISCNCSALEFAIENLSNIKLSRDGSQPMEGELVCGSGLKTDTISTTSQSFLNCQKPLKIDAVLWGNDSIGLLLASNLDAHAPRIELYTWDSTGNGEILVRTPQSGGAIASRVLIPGKSDFIDIKIKDSNLIPYEDNYQDLGSSGNRWKNIYAVSGNFSGVILPDAVLLNSANITSNANNIENLSAIKLSRDGSQPMTGLLQCEAGLKTNTISTVSGDTLTCDKDLVVNSHIWGNPLLTIGSGAEFPVGYPHIKFFYNDIEVYAPGDSGPVKRIHIHGGWDDGDIVIENADVFPYTDNRWDLGSSGYTWRCVYAAKGNFSGTIIPDAILANSANISDLDARVDYLEENLSSNVSCNCSALEYSIQNLSLIKLSRDGSQSMTGLLKCESGLETDTITSYSGNIIECTDNLKVDGDVVGNSSDGLNLIAEDTAVASRIQLTPGSNSKILLGTFSGQSIVPRIEIPEGSGNVDITVRGAHLIPYIDTEQDLGNPSKRWKNIYAVSSLFSNVQVESRIWSNNTFTIGYSNSTTENTQIRLTSTDLTLMTPDSNGTSTERLSLTGNADRSIVYIKNAHLLPYDNLSSYLGSSAHRWIEVFANTGSFTKIGALGTSILDIDDDVKLDRRLWGKHDLILAGGDPSYGHAQIRLFDRNSSSFPGALSFLTTDSVGAPTERIHVSGDADKAQIDIKNADVVPYDDESYNLGSLGFRWKNIYARFVHSSNISSLEERIEYLESIIGEMGGRGPYTAIIYKDNGIIYAKNANGETITQGAAGTDDTSVIRTAMNSVSNGGKIFFGEGVFTITGNTSTTGDSITIAGTGRNTILRLADGANCEFFNINHDGITIQDIEFDGNVEHQTDGYAAIKVIPGVKDLIVKNCYFQNIWRAAIKGEGTSDEPIIRVSVHDCTGKHFRDSVSHEGGLVWLSHAKDVRLTDLFCDDFGDSDVRIDGVKVIRSKNIQISKLTGIEVTAHFVFVGYGSENIEISDIFMYNGEIGGLEPVCIEWAGDNTHTGTPRNKKVTINNVIYVTEAGVNNGLFVWTADDVTVENCISEVLNQPIATLFNFRYLKNANIVNCIAVGQMGSDRSHFFISDCESVSISNCVSADVPTYSWTQPPRAGMEIYGECKDIFVSHCTFKNLPTRGIYLQVQSKKRITIRDCQFIDVGKSGQGVTYAINANPDQVSGLYILDNLFAVENSAYMRGVYIASGNDDVIIKGNVFRGTFIGNNIVEHQAGVTGLIIKNNEGYPTEKSGIATIASGASSVVVNHGLDGAPSIITLTGTHSEVANCWVTDVTDAQFTINAPSAVTDDRDVYWKAAMS